MCVCVCDCMHICILVAQVLFSYLHFSRQMLRCVGYLTQVAVADAAMRAARLVCAIHLSPCPTFGSHLLHELC